VSDTVDFGVIRIIADDHEEAKKRLLQEGLSFAEVDVLVLEMQNRPGALAQIAHRLSKAKVNVEYVYSGASDEKGSAKIILRVSNLARAKQARGTI
ncbi:MAG: ACT domain-containing protein, partial [Planctomycetota bacterium]